MADKTSCIYCRARSSEYAPSYVTIHIHSIHSNIDKKVDYIHIYIGQNDVRGQALGIIHRLLPALARGIQIPPTHKTRWLLSSYIQQQHQQQQQQQYIHSDDVVHIYIDMTVVIRYVRYRLKCVLELNQIRMWLHLFHHHHFSIPRVPLISLRYGDHLYRDKLSSRFAFRTHDFRMRSFSDIGLNIKVALEWERSAATAAYAHRINLFFERPLVE